MRPSSLIDVSDPYAAYCFDEVCSIWHDHVEEKVLLASKDLKDSTQKELVQRRVFADIMGETKQGEDVPPPKGMFRDPAVTME